MGKKGTEKVKKWGVLREKILKKRKDYKKLFVLFKKMRLPCLCSCSSTLTFSGVT